jgi:hypothetical protein
MNFRGGKTSLTMLSSHHWLGMAFAFLLVILSDKQQETAKDCFHDGDAPEPDCDWDMVPGLDLDKAYTPPILQSKGLGDEAGCSSDEDSSRDGNSSGNLSDNDGSSDYGSRESEEHLIDGEDECGNQGGHSHENLLSSDDSEPKKKVAKDAKKLVKMTCS